MSKSIHERVRAKLEKQARDEQRKAERKHDARMRRLERADLKREAEIERHNEEWGNDIDYMLDWPTSDEDCT